MDLVDYDEQRFAEHPRRASSATPTALGIDRDARDDHPDLGARRRERRRTVPADALVRRPDAARTTSRPSRSPMPETCRRGSRCSTSSARSAPSTATIAAMPAPSPPGCCARATTVVVLPSGVTTTVAADRHGRRSDRRGGSGSCRHRRPCRRRRRVARRRDRDHSATAGRHQRADGGAGVARRHGTARAAQHLPPQAHDAIGAGDGHRRAASHRHRAARCRQPRRHAVAQRGRRRHAAHDRAGLRRRLPAQPGRPAASSSSTR